jgi:hypothetical protein
MPGARFNTDQAVFDAFPHMGRYVRTKPLDIAPADFVNRLMAQSKAEEALSFCAFLLPRREAIAWACKVMRMDLDTGPASPSHAALEAAETWVKAPAEDARRAAQDRWAKAEREDPKSWVALAVAQSGGRRGIPGQEIPDVPENLTAIAVRVALLLKLHRQKPHERLKCAQNWLSVGLQLAENGL